MRLLYMFLFTLKCFLLFVCLFVLILNVPVNIFSVISGRSHRFSLGTTSRPTFWGANVSYTAGGGGGGGGRYRTPRLRHIFVTKLIV